MLQAEARHETLSPLVVTRYRGHYSPAGFTHGSQKQAGAIVAVPRCAPPSPMKTRYAARPVLDDYQPQGQGLVAAMACIDYRLHRQFILIEPTGKLNVVISPPYGHGPAVTPHALYHMVAQTISPQPSSWRLQAIYNVCYFIQDYFPFARARSSLADARRFFDLASSSWQRNTSISYERYDPDLPG